MQANSLLPEARVHIPIAIVDKTDAKEIKHMTHCDMGPSVATVCMYVCVSMCVCTIYAYVHTYILTFTQASMYAHIHMYMHKLGRTMMM